jgi:lysophospholipase L1-like esterase
MSGRAMRICFIGDSFVSGAFDPECLGWAGRISASARARGHDVSPYNLGIRGETSAQIARRWRIEAESRQSAQQEGRLVFQFGVNDAREVNGKPQLEVAQSLSTAREMLSQAVEWKPTLMIGPPPGCDDRRNERVRELSIRFASLCAALKIPYFDSFTPLMQSAAWLPSCNAVDGTHPDAAGYAEWARLIEGWPGWRNWVP